MNTLNIADIIVNNKYLRLNSDVSELKKSIETIGLINPLTLNSKNELIAGARRYKALKELNITSVPIHRIEKRTLEEELISIDENLMRLNLNKLEFEKCLKRGLEIFDQLKEINDNENISSSVESNASTSPKNNIALQEENLNKQSTITKNEQGQTLSTETESAQTFIDLTAQKTGLSKRVIKSAIDRDLKASQTIKSYRKNGELNASQTNELIKLSHEDQEKVADVAKGRSAKEIKEIVRAIKDKGLDNTLNDVLSNPKSPKEYQALETLLVRTSKVVSKILLEGVQVSSSEENDIKTLIDNTIHHLSELQELYKGHTE